jgi:hypothetical protein
LASVEGNDDGVGIAEDSVNVRGRGEPREGVEVAELSELCHHVIVTDFVTVEKRITPWKNSVSKASGGENYPHYFTKSQNVYGAVRFLPLRIGQGA